MPSREQLPSFVGEQAQREDGGDPSAPNVRVRRTSVCVDAKTREQQRGCGVPEIEVRPY
jgi:hypothetical protein